MKLDEASAPFDPGGQESCGLVCGILYSLYLTPIVLSKMLYYRWDAIKCTATFSKVNRGHLFQYFSKYNQVWPM